MIVYFVSVSNRFLHCTIRDIGASNIWTLLIIRINPQTMNALNTANVDPVWLFARIIFVNNVVNKLLLVTHVYRT